MFALLIIKIFKIQPPNIRDCYFSITHFSHVEKLMLFIKKLNLSSVNLFFFFFYQAKLIGYYCMTLLGNDRSLMQFHEEKKMYPTIS